MLKRLIVAVVCIGALLFGQITGDPMLKVVSTINEHGASTSANLADVLSDETGSGGGFVRATLPTINRAVITGSSYPVSEVNRETAGTNFILSSEEIKATSSANIIDNFGVRLAFTWEDDTTETVAHTGISAIRAGADDTTDLAFEVSNAGTLVDRFRIISDGTFSIEGTGAADANDLILTASPTGSRTFTFPDETGTGITTVSAAGSLANSSVLAADLEDDLRDMKIPFIIEDAATGDSGDFQHEVPDACTLTEIACNVSSDGTSVTINFYERARATPETGTTEMLTADLVCDTNGATTTSFTDSALAKDVPFALAIDAVSGAPTWLRVYATCQR